MNLPNFLNALGHTERIYIRCLLPPRLPLDVAETLGMSFKTKDDKLAPLPISGVLDLKSGAFARTYKSGRSEHIADGMGHLQTLNQQGYGVYFVPHHGNGFKAADITHGVCLFHESDRLSLEAQQQTIDKISAEFGEPTAIVKTRKSLHAYWRCTEDIQVESLGNLQRRWLQYSECDDPSLADPAQLMRMPGFDHVSWNAETRALERVQCELIHLSSDAYSLEQFDKILPPLDLERWVKASLEVCPKETTSTDIRAFSEYLDGFKANGRRGWITAKCPAHNGDSDDSLHIEQESGGWVCHAGCHPSAVYKAAKAVAIARGYRLPTSDEPQTKNKIDYEELALEIGNRFAEFNINTLFHPTVCHQLEQIAKVFNQPCGAVAAPLLSIAGSLLQVGTVVNLGSKTNHSQPPIVWVSLVGDSDDGKSPILKMLTQPLTAMQAQAYRDYQERKTQYEVALCEWDEQKKGDRGQKPIEPKGMRRFAFSNFTQESIGHALIPYPQHGALVSVDELAGMIKGMGQFKKSGGNDRQEWLSLYDGHRLDISRRTSEPIFIEKTCIPVLGGIQPVVLNDVMGKLEHVDGFWTRFFYAKMQNSRMPCIDWSDDRDTGLEQTLMDAYQRLDAYQPIEYSLDPNSRQIWQEWHEFTEDERFNHDHPAKRALFRKARARAARIALIAHCFNAAVNGEEQPSPYISAETLQGAINFTKWGLSQILSIYSDFGVTDAPDMIRLAKFVERFKESGWVGWKRVRSWWSASTKPVQKTCLDFMTTVIEQGYARGNGELGGKLQIIVIESSHLVTTSPNPNAGKALSLVTDLVTVTKNLVTELEPTGGRGDGIDSVTRNLVTVTKSVTNPKPLESIGFDLCRDYVTKLLENKNENQNESKSNDSAIESNTEQTVDSYCEFSATTSQGSKRDWIEMDVNPRDCLSVADGRIEVDLERLDLAHQTSVDIPHWEPKTALKPYENLSKLHIDIETTGLDPVKDRVIMVGLMNENGQKTILTDPSEKAILKELIEYLRVNKPDLLIGHNLFGFDLPFIIERCKRKGITQPFRQGRKTQRITSASMNGKPIEFTSVYWTGVNIIDTMQQIAIWDKQASRLTSYGLKPSTIALGLRDERRLELSNDEIQQCWQSGDISTLGQYLNYDLEDTALLADFLLPVVYYQMGYVPGLSFQELAIASPALKAQKIHTALLPVLTPDADEPLKYEGGKVDLLAPGLHRNVAKIDVSSLYPSVMLRYGVCSKKDPDHRFLGVMAYMTQERLKLKEQAKQGDKAASFQEKSLKILINGSYGFLGTGGYTFNDFEAAALVTAYGRKILNLMMAVVSSCGATVIEVDTDGIFFSHDEPKAVYDLVQDALPEGINIELELENCGLYAPKAKSYVIVHPNGKTTVKGLFRKRDRYPLEREFPVEFLRLYFTESPEAAKVYYNSIRESILNRSIPVDQLTITRRIGSAEKTLVELGLGKVGDRVSFWYTEQQRVHGRSGKALKSVRVETQTELYWIDYYLQQLDELYQSITGDGSLRLAELPLFQETAA
jgi:DNA polymerase, archaea type